MFGVQVTRHEDGKTPPKQADSSEAIRGREGDRYTARIFTGLLGSMTWIVVASRYSRSWTGKAWCPYRDGPV